MICVAFLWSAALMAQQRTHHVESGETLYGISRQYSVSIEALVEANPFLNEGLKEGQDLTIPASDLNTNRLQSTADTSRYDVHVVEAGQTLYSLSRLWNLSIEDLIELNPQLEDGLKIGQELRLPKGTLKTAEESAQPDLRDGMQKHLVLPGETVYSLSRGAGWTEEAFLEANPKVREEGLESGTYVWLPTVETTQLVREIVLTDITPVEVPDTLLTHSDKEVRDSTTGPQPRYKVVRIEQGDSWTTLERKYATSKEELIRRNPEMINGIHPGRYIIVPTAPVVDSNDEETLRSNWMELGDRKVHFALALPLFLEENDSLAAAYVQGTSAPRVYPRSQIAMDFYAGLKVAIDTLRSFGLEVEMDVYDTRNDPIMVRRIAEEIGSSGAEFVIGPLYSRNAEEMARELPDEWIISPLSRTVETQRRMRLVQAASSMDQEYLELARWINEEARDANVVFVRRNLDDQKQRVRNFMQHLEASEYRTISHITMGETLLRTQDIRNRLAAGKRDVFVVLDDDPVLMTSFVNGAANLRDSSISVLTTSKLLGMRTLEVEKLNRLDVYMSDVEYIDYDAPHTNAFLSSFRSTMGTEPVRFAYHGYDVGLYFIPLFALTGDHDNIVWPGNYGLIKRHRLSDHAGEGPANTGVYLLHLEDYHWVPKN